jgi:hypothetical protein
LGKQFLGKNKLPDDLTLSVYSGLDLVCSVHGISYLKRETNIAASLEKPLYGVQHRKQLLAIAIILSALAGCAI